MSYIPVKINLTKNNKSSLLKGKGINLSQSQLNHGNNLMLHPLNYQKLKNKDLNKFMMTQGELFATAQNNNNNINGAGLFDWLSDNASSIFDTIGTVASFIPGIGPIASTIGREAVRAVSGKGI